MSGYTIAKKTNSVDLTAQTFEDNEYELTPDELGISWTVDLDRKDYFIGKATLLKEKERDPRFKTTSRTIDQQCDVAEGMKLYTAIDGKVLQAGTCPSVAWSYGLNHWLGPPFDQIFLGAILHIIADWR